MSHTENEASESSGSLGFWSRVRVNYWFYRIRLEVWWESLQHPNPLEEEFSQRYRLAQSEEERIQIQVEYHNKLFDQLSEKAHALDDEDKKSFFDLCYHNSQVAWRNFLQSGNENDRETSITYTKAANSIGKHLP